MDFYEILGVQRDANLGQLKLAFHARVRAQQRTLDPNPRTMALLGRAYMVLSNERRRQSYDSQLPPDRRELLRRAAQRSLFDEYPS